MANTTDYSRLLDGYALLAIKDYIKNNYAAKSHTHTKSQITDFPTSMPASDVYAWAKASTKPSYSFSEISSRGEAFLSWGGQSFSGSFAPIDAAMVSQLSANRVAGIDGSYITIEKSNNGGSSWTTISTSDFSNTSRKALFTTSSGIKLRYGSVNQTTDRLRITMDATNGGVYSSINKIMMYVSTSGSTGCKVYIETAYYATPTVWHEVGTFDISGWSGWNVINTGLPGTGALGGSNSDNHNRFIRFTFSCTGVNSTYTDGLNIYKIYIFGGVGWSTPSTLAANGVPYSYDQDGNIYCASIYENGTALSSKYAAYSHTHSYVPLSGGTMTGKLQVNALIFGYNYTNGNNRASFMFDKPGSNYTGIGAHAESDTIYFGACNASGEWVDTYKQKWKFNGTIIEDGTALADKYLGKAAKAADSDKLDGHDSSYFINTDNIASQSVYYADNAGYSSESHTLNGQEASYYLNYNNLTNKPSAVLYTSQTLTDAQKTQARTNIGAGTSSFTGYTSSNKLSTNYIQNDAGWSSFSGYSSSNKLHTDYINNAAGWTSVTELTVSGWGFTKNAGTVTSVKVGSTSYSPSSGVVSLPAYPTKSSWNYDDVYVKLTGNQSIAGNKSFTGKIIVTDNQNSYAFVPGQEGDLALELVNESSQTTTVYLMNPNTPNTAQYIALRSWVSDNYLGKTAKAADADKLDGNDSSYFINTSNIGSQSVYHSEVSDYATDAGTAANSTSLGGNGPAYYLNYNNFTNKPSAVLYTSQSLTDAQKTQARSNIGAGTSSLAIGTTASTAAAGNHTHTLSIASGGTSSINLQANTTYTLTAGGKTYAFKTPASGGYYSNQYNEAYYLSSNSAASLWSEDIQAGMAVIGLGGGNATVIGIGWPGLASGSFKRSLLFTGNRVDLTLIDRDQNYLKGLSIDMYDDDYYTLHIRANEYSDLYGSVNTENYAHVNLHAYSFVYTPYSTNSAVSYRKYVDLGVVMHNINYTYSSTVLLKMNIRGTGANDGAITSYASLCSLLYYAGHRSAATCLTCSGRYSSYSYIVLGVYATSYNSGLYLAYCSASSNTISTLSIPNGTVTDTLSASLVP